VSESLATAAVRLRQAFGTRRWSAPRRGESAD
jgi:hypothetical protein